MKLIDSHTHLYLPQFDADRPAIMERAAKAGVERFYLPAIDKAVAEPMFAMESEYPGRCFAMMGLHPCSVNATYRDEMDWVEKSLRSRWFAAVGEIGLDFYWDTTFAKEQEACFRTQIEWALQYDRPIVIHTRKAMQATIDIVKEYKGRGLRGVFHCFTDSYEMGKMILDAGFFLGIGGVVTYKNAGLKETLKKIPIDVLMLETDAPYLTPVPHRGKRNESSYLTYIVQELSGIYGISDIEVAEATSAATEQLFA